MLKSLLSRMHPRLLPFFATILICALGINLGNWQTRRAAEKERLAIVLNQQSEKPAISLNKAAAKSEMTAFRRVTMQGEFVKEWPIYLDNRPLNGVAGFYVLMPFKLSGSTDVILVARGWQPRNPAQRTKMPLLTTPIGLTQIDGVLRDNLDRSMQLGEADAVSPAAIVQNLSIANVGKQTGFAMLNMVLEQSTDTQDGLRRTWPKPSAGSDKHRAYAFQWYGLALMAFIFFVVTGIRRGKNRNTN